MSFTPRTQQILGVMLDCSDHPVSKQYIADRIGVSKRTVQREFDYIESELKGYGISVENKKGKGVRLLGDSSDLDRLREDIEGNAEPDPGNIEERRRHLLFELLKDRSPRKLYYYADLLGVSEATAGTDMDSLRPWLSRNHLKVVKRPGYGVILTGSEKDYREAMRRFISENYEKEKKIPAESGAVQAVMDAGDSGIYSLLNSDTVSRVRDVLDAMREKESRLRKLADSAYAGLVIHISISVERIRKNAYVTVRKDTEDSLESWPEYELARKILTAMENEFHIIIPKEEIAYILLHIRGSRIAYSDEALNSEKPEMEEEELLDVIDRMIVAYDPENADSYRLDEEFIRGLLVHLRPVIVRLRGQMNIINPVLDDIKEEYPDVYKRTQRASAVLSDALGLPVSDEETGFLAMHFGAAQERIESRKGPSRRKVEIGVVCASGFGVARLMLTKLSGRLKDSANIKAYGKEEITGYVESNTDFFVSTMDLDSLDIDYVRVSPMITENDFEVIRGKVDEYSMVRRDRPQEEQDFSRQLDAANFVTREIKGIIGRYRRLTVHSRISFNDLLWAMAMNISGNIETAGKIVEGILAREAMNSQIFPDLGIALFHCRTGAVRDAFFITCSPSDAEMFSSENMKGIRAAVMMLSPEDENKELHREILGQISSAFVSTSSFLEAVKSGTQDDIKEQLTQALRRYFYDFLGRL